MDYNSYVMGIHNYYSMATHANQDFSEIGFSVKRTMKCRLGQRLKKSGNSLPQYVQEKYGRSKELRYIRGLFVLPISYVQTRRAKTPAKKLVCIHPRGRAQVHKSLEKVNLSILHYLMEHPVPSESIEYNDNGWRSTVPNRESALSPALFWELEISTATTRPAGPMAAMTGIPTL